MGIYEVDGETDDIVSMADRAYIARQTIKNKGDTAWAFYDGAVRDKLLHEKEIESQMEKLWLKANLLLTISPSTVPRAETYRCRSFSTLAQK